MISTEKLGCLVPFDSPCYSTFAFLLAAHILLSFLLFLVFLLTTSTVALYWYRLLPRLML